MALHREGKVFGELEPMVGLGRISSAECYEESVLLCIELDTFSALLKEYFTRKLQRVILFFKSMSFLKHTSVKSLLLFAARCTQARVPSKTVLARQSHPATHLFFVKTGRVKVIKDLTFIREAPSDEMPSADVFAHALYQEPSPADLRTGNVRRLKLEVCECGQFESFGDERVRGLGEIDEAEWGLYRYSGLTMMPSDVVFVQAMDFLDFLHPEDVRRFKNNLKTYPPDRDLRRFYFEQKSWKSYKAGLLAGFNRDLRKQPQQSQFEMFSLA